MEYSYEINEVSKTITVIIEGEVNARNFAKLNVEICTLAVSLHCKIIFDFTSAIVDISIGEAYFWFANHLDKINILFRRIPTAHIVNEKNESFFYFVETTWTNHGINTKMFKEGVLAQDWLNQIG